MSKQHYHKINNAPGLYSLVIGLSYYWQHRCHDRTALNCSNESSHLLYTKPVWDKFCMCTKWFCDDTNVVNESSTGYSPVWNEPTLVVFNRLGACSLLGSELMNRLLQIANLLTKHVMHSATRRTERTSAAFLRWGHGLEQRYSGNIVANRKFCFSWAHTFVYWPLVLRHQ